MSRDLIIQGNTFLSMKEQVDILVKSGFLPSSIKTAEQALAVAIKGVEVGMPLMQSFSHINIIEGRPTISAEGMNYLIRKNCPKAILNIVEMSAQRCAIKAARPGQDELVYEFSIEDAKKALLLANPAWQKYPKNMLFARCLANVGRTMFADCLGGISYTPEELGVEVVDEHT